VLDQRLLRDNPEQIAAQLARRGVSIDLSGLQQIAREERNLEQQRSTLQAEGNGIGKQVGHLIQGGAAPDSPEVRALREAGNRLKQQVAVLEDAEKSLEIQLREQLLTLPNLPAAETPMAAMSATTSRCCAGEHRGNRRQAKPSKSTGRSPSVWGCSRANARCASPRAGS